jgi:myo-inositol-hexaphosphate 3-phosphohydrolase
VVTTPLGPAYPAGLLVVQDGANDPQLAVEDEGELENSSTNFKYVSWAEVLAALGWK